MRNPQPNQDWAIRLFNRSPLKQRKYRELTALLGEAEGLRCLDIGADNGVLSYLFRQRSGSWESGDLDPQAIEAIRRLVGSNVYQIDGRQVPVVDNSFDRVVIVDFLEHVITDREFVEDLHRILKPDGELIVNVPYAKDSLLRKLRLSIGQTDEKHGHVRPGYTEKSLHQLLDDRFTVISCHTYSKFFSEILDTIITATLYTLKGEAGHSQKGTIVTGQDINKYGKLFWMYSVIFPLVWFFVQLDRILFWRTGYMLIAKARVNK